MGGNMQVSRSRKRFARVGVLAAVALVVGMVVMPSAGQAVPSVRGFDGTTVTLASMGIAAQFPGVPTGVQARIKRFNDNNEIKGVKLKYTENADDKQDPATSLSEARRLVTQEGVFAIVGDTSQSNPVDFFAQQHVPYFGWAFDGTYCSPKPVTTLWGFGYDGCLVPSNPKVMPDSGAPLYAYAVKQTGKQHPTVAIFGNDTQSGKNAVQYQASSYQGAGFNVTYAKGPIPPPPVSDYTPYAQEVLKGGANGAAPDVIVCLLSTDCIPMYSLIQANNYKGVYQSFLYSDQLLKPMNGSVAAINFVNLNESTPALTQMKADVEAVKPGAAIDTGVATAYFTTDMFIQALKTAAKKGKSNITPEAVQKAAAVQTWQIKGLAGPTKYPNSTVKSFPACTSLVSDDGTAWKTVEPFACSTKGYPVLPKFKS
jgi:branched-chain amino acid transport system substrate-binding protein